MQNAQALADRLGVDNDTLTELRDWATRRFPEATAAEVEHVAFHELSHLDRALRGDGPYGDAPSPLSRLAQR